jgi:acetamidase/formamidase
MDVTLKVELRKKASLDNPRVETATHIISVGSQPEFVSSLDRSLRLATSDMVNWLVKEYRMEPWAAHLLVGYQGRYDVITVAGSMALRIPRSSLPSK